MESTNIINVRRLKFKLFNYNPVTSILKLNSKFVEAC